MKSKLHYLAGIVDGEGCLNVKQDLYRTGDPTKRSWVITLDVQMDDPRPIDMLRDVLGVGRVSLCHPPTEQRRGRPRSWRYRAASQNAACALKRLAPYLIVKRERAIALIAMAKETAKYRQDRTRYSRVKVDGMARAFIAAYGTRRRKQAPSIFDSKED